MLLQTLVSAGFAAAAGIKGLEQVQNLVLFGDSYTDEGRLAWFMDHDGKAPPPGTIIPPSNKTASGGYAWPHFASQALNATAFNYAGKPALARSGVGERLGD